MTIVEQSLYTLKCRKSAAGLIECGFFKPMYVYVSNHSTADGPIARFWNK
jgi:hypothetical protein